MARLMAEQLELDFFAPLPEKTEEPASVKSPVSQVSKPAVKMPETSERVKFNRDGSRKLDDFGEDLGNQRKGKTKETDGNVYQPVGEIEKRLAKESLDSVWPKESILELHKTRPTAAACLWLVRDMLSGKKPSKNAANYSQYLKIGAAAIALQRQVISGELAPEAELAAFDCFYSVRKAEVYLLAAADTKYWSVIAPWMFKDAKEICSKRGFTLSDHSDIDSYPYQCVIQFHGRDDVKDVLHLINKDGQDLNYPVVVGKTEEEFKRNFNKELEACFRRYLDTQKEWENKEKEEKKKELPIRLYGRGYRHPNSVSYEIYGKQGSIELQLTDSADYESDDAFRQYLREHQAELECKYRELRAEYSKSEKDWKSQSPIRERIGPDYRGGKDATPEMFMATFGFRGVEFGNWVKQGKHSRERQWMLNNSFDSLCDLAKILNVPTKAVALNGELGLCFGSRGFGSASAHYDPQNRLINLTKTKGYSSLAHEWFHALDHQMMRKYYADSLQPLMISEKVDSRFGFKLTAQAKERINRAAQERFLKVDAASSFETNLTVDPELNFIANKVAAGKLEYATFNIHIPIQGRYRIFSETLRKEDLIPHEKGLYGSSIRPELHHAWAQTIDSIRSSAMHKRMQKKNAYWQSKTEEAARSFEAFVEVRCKELNIQNDFLTNAAFSEKSLGKDNFYPYLDGEDVKKVCDKFRELFAVIKNKETEKGVELYSREITEKAGTPRLDIRELLTKEFGENGIVQLIKANKLYIAQNQEEALFIHAAKERDGSFQTLSVQEPINEKILGFYDPKAKCSYLVADNLTKENAVAVVLHEIGVHMSRDSQFKERTERLITQANELFQEGLKEKDPLMEKVQKRLLDSNVQPFFKNYKEEVCGYLIEEAAKEINKTPKVHRWFQEVTSTVKVWLSEHGVLDVSRLKTQDLVTIAKANVKEIARQKTEAKLSPEGMKVLAEHVKAMNFKYSKITDAEPEIKTLYRKFVELEQAGKPLPKAAVVEKPKSGLQR